MCYHDIFVVTLIILLAFDILDAPVHIASGKISCINLLGRVVLTHTFCVIIYA